MFAFMHSCKQITLPICVFFHFLLVKTDFVKLVNKIELPLNTYNIIPDCASLKVYKSDFPIY